MKRRNEYFWVIGGGLLQVPLIDEVKQLGYKVIVSDMNSKCICANKAGIFLEIDIFDIQKHIHEALKLKSEGVKISAVLAAGIDATVTMACLARTLGLPGVDPLAAFITNNKNVFRKTLKKLGYPVPKFATISDTNQVDLAVKKVDFPLIVKSTDSSGSRGIKIFRKGSVVAVKEAVKAAMRVSRSGLALIEELWEGDEFTVETIFDFEGNYHPCFITDRIFNKDGDFALELGLRNPTNLSMRVQKQMYSLTKSVAKNIGINIGAAKVDMMLTKDGPRIIEMTTRLSGGFDCQYLVPVATGMNVIRAAILTALGKKFSSKELLSNKKKRVGVTGSIWPKSGKIVNITGINSAKKLDGVEYIFLRYKKGDLISPYIDCTKRICFIITTGEDEQKARATLEKAINIIKIETE